MNILSGTIVEIYEEGGMRMGKIKVGAAFVRVPISLVDAEVGDTVLIESGVAIAKVSRQTLEEN
jgi:hydrogenase maturation factor